MNKQKPTTQKHEKPICIYRTMYLSGNSTTFREPLNSDLKRCVVCNGYDENCLIYTDMRRFMTKVEKSREEFRERLNQTDYEIDERKRMDEFRAKVRKLKGEKNK